MPRSLFNNPFLSDVTIHQIYEGEVKEYYAHKAVLCAHSAFFMNAFSGTFKVGFCYRSSRYYNSCPS